MASKEQGSFREKIGHGAFWGGIVAGLIGLVTMPELIVPGIALAGTGVVISHTGKKN